MSGLYRIYRRFPVIKGKWYYHGICGECGEKVHILEDPTLGKKPVKLTGDGVFAAPCLNCFAENFYKTADVVVAEAEADKPSPTPDRVPISNASRQPLKTKSGSKSTVFGVGYVEDRPAIAAIIGRIITSWADIEVECSRLLAELMGSHIPTAAAVFGSLRNSRTQHDALEAAAKIALNDTDYKLFAAHMARKASLEKERNDLAHGCFGVCPARQDSIVWVSQADYIAHSATHQSDPKAGQKFHDAQFIYSEGTLERIAQEIVQFYEQLGALRGYIYARRDGSPGQAFRALRYPQLCSQPHIQQALDRIRAAKKASPAPKPKKASKPKPKPKL